MYSAIDIVDKTLYAIAPVEVKNQPWDDAAVVRIVQPGGMVGVVYTFVEPKAGRSHLYWKIQDVFGAELWVAHKPGFFDLEKLREQGLLTIEEKNIIEDYPEWYELGTDLISESGSLLLKVGLGILAIKIIPKLISK